MRAIAAAFLCLCLTVGCDKKSEKETLPAEQRLLTFADDDAFLDYIQRTHLNYMWDGAEPTSGLAHPYRRRLSAKRCRRRDYGR